MRVTILAFPQAQLLDITGPCDVFSEASLASNTPNIRGTRVLDFSLRHSSLIVMIKHISQTTRGQSSGSRGGLLDDRDIRSHTILQVASRKIEKLSRSDGHVCHVETVPATANRKGEQSCTTRKDT